MKSNWKSRLKSQIIIFSVLFLVLEIILRIFGFRAGTSIDEFKPQTHPEYVERFVSDESGINHLKRGNSMSMPGTVINNQGFRGDIDYTPHTIDSLKKRSGKEVVMIIGDSYVEGCCPDSVSISFPDLLNKSKKYAVLNFGVAGTDPLQYELVAKKYIPLLKPDRVVVAIYFGNDISFFKRVPTPYVPLTFPFKNNKWIFQVAPNYLSGEVDYLFKSEKEAYQFFLDKYTLRGNNRNGFEKTISYSVIFSKLYLAVELRRKLWKWQDLNRNVKVVDADEVTYSRISNISNICDSLNVPLLFVGIPAPEEAKEGKGLKAKYQKDFKTINWHVPFNFTTDDYDGKDAGNHFNNQGHKKYADFLEQLLDKKEK